MWSWSVSPLKVKWKLHLSVPRIAIRIWWSFLSHQIWKCVRKLFEWVSFSNLWNPLKSFHFRYVPTNGLDCNQLLVPKSTPYFTKILNTLYILEEVVEQPNTIYLACMCVCVDDYHMNVHCLCILCSASSFWVIAHAKYGISFNSIIQLHHGLLMYLTEV